MTLSEINSIKVREMPRLFLNAVTLSHKYIREAVSNGDTVVDATVGNGSDTVLLADLVGKTGRVIGFDTQRIALDKTCSRLRKAGMLERVSLIAAGHQYLDRYVHQPITACMFNLGYLPGGEHCLVTLPETTRTALEQVLKLLEKNGIVTIVIYTGHEGGEKEAYVISQIIESLPQELWDVAEIKFPNRRNNSPYLIVIQRR